MTTRKILSLDMLLARLAEHRRRLDRIVFSNGCFDLFHAGHLATLEAARLQGDVLMVAVNSDASVRRLKGPGRPVVPHQERARILAGLECVNYVTIFEEDTPERLIAAIRPDVLVKSAKEASRVVGRELVESYGGRVVMTPVVPGMSTTVRLAEIVGEDGCERWDGEAVVRGTGVVPGWGGIGKRWEPVGSEFGELPPPDREDQALSCAVHIGVAGGVALAIQPERLRLSEQRIYRESSPVWCM